MQAVWGALSICVLTWGPHTIVPAQGSRRLTRLYHLSPQQIPLLIRLFALS